MSEVESIKRLIETYPTYLSIYKKYIKGEKVNKELDELYRPIFSKILMPYYMEIMPNIKEISELLKKNYSDEDSTYAIIDYLEFLCGNIYYETFVYELDKLDKTSLKPEHLVVFKYILYVEYIKYSIYTNILSTIDLDSKYKPAMIKRKDFTLRKINYTIDLIEKKYSNTHPDFISECKEIVRTDFKIELTNEYFNSKINYINLCK